MPREQIQVPAGGIRWWLIKRHVPLGARVDVGTPICFFEMTTGVFSDGPEADYDLEAYASGIIQWAEIKEGTIVEQEQVIGWIDTA